MDGAFALVYQAYRSAGELDLHLFVVDTQLPKNSSVQIAVIVAVLDGLITYLIGGAMRDAALHPAPGKPA